jgi:hypothetical protein
MPRSNAATPSRSIGGSSGSVRHGAGTGGRRAQLRYKDPADCKLCSRFVAALICVNSQLANNASEETSGPHRACIMPS